MDLQALLFWNSHHASESMLACASGGQLQKSTACEDRLPHLTPKQPTAQTINQCSKTDYGSDFIAYDGYDKKIQ